MKRVPTYDPATIGIVTTVISGIQLVGGIVQGIDSSNKNAMVEADQARLRQNTEAQLQQLVNSVDRNRYNEIANRDIASQIRVIAEAMSDRGIGGSSAAFAAAADSIAQTQVAYGQRQLQDQIAARQTQASGLYNLSTQTPLTYNDKPFEGVFDGLSGVLGGLDMISGVNRNSVTSPQGAKPAELGDTSGLPKPVIPPAKPSELYQTPLFVAPTPSSQPRPTVRPSIRPNVR